MDRVKVIGERHKKLYKPQLLEENYDIFEYKELSRNASLEDGSTLVVRMPNPAYKPFDEPFNKAMVLFVSVFFGGHIILLIGIIFYRLAFLVNLYVHSFMYYLESSD